MTRIMLAAALALIASAEAVAASELEVTPEQRTALGIELADVQTVSEAAVAVLPGVVRLPGDSTRSVVLPCAGTVVKVLAQDGQEVRRGDPLLQLRSRDCLQVDAELQAAEARTAVLRARVDRDRALVAEGIAPARQAQESAAELRVVEAQRASQSAMLSSMRAVPGAPGDYLMLAPADGFLSGQGLMAGDTAAADSVAFFVYAGDTVWLDAQLGARLADQVRPGYRVEAGEPAQAGRVIAVGRSIDPETRAVLVRAELGVGVGLRPGQVTELRVFAPVEAGTVLVPSAAVTRMAGQDTVFLATDRGFVPVAVEAGLRTSDGVAVRGTGLAGGRVASAGVSALKAMAQGN